MAAGWARWLASRLTLPVWLRGHAADPLAGLLGLTLEGRAQTAPLPRPPLASHLKPPKTLQFKGQNSPVVMRMFNLSSLIQESRQTVGKTRGMHCRAREFAPVQVLRAPAHGATSAGPSSCQIWRLLGSLAGCGARKTNSTYGASTGEARPLLCSRASERAKTRPGLIVCPPSCHLGPPGYPARSCGAAVAATPAEASRCEGGVRLEAKRGGERWREVPSN